MTLNNDGPITVRPGAAYQEVVRSTIPPAEELPTLPPPPPVPRIPEDTFQRIMDACQLTVEQAFKGRSEKLRVVRNSGSLTIVVHDHQECQFGRVIVSKRFGKEIYNVWVQYPPSGPSSCVDIGLRVDVALLLDSLLPQLKKLTKG